MSKLPPLPHWCESGSPFAEQMQAYATAATEPLLQRIAELEEMNAQLREQNTEVDKACADLEQRNSDLYEAAPGQQGARRMAGGGLGSLGPPTPSGQHAAAT